jgi:hypothetical protein
VAVCCRGELPSVSPRTNFLGQAPAFSFSFFFPSPATGLWEWRSSDQNTSKKPKLNIIIIINLFFSCFSVRIFVHVFVLSASGYVCECVCVSLRACKFYQAWRLGGVSVLRHQVSFLSVCVVSVCVFLPALCARLAKIALLNKFRFEANDVVKKIYCTNAKQTLQMYTKQKHFLSLAPHNTHFSPLEGKEKSQTFHPRGSHICQVPCPRRP